MQVSFRTLLYFIMFCGLLIHTKDEPKRVNRIEVSETITSLYTKKVNLGILKNSLIRLERTPNDDRQL